ncbi:unnamed protein product, partial [marine sediment metagenome]
MSSPKIIVKDTRIIINNIYTQNLSDEFMNRLQTLLDEISNDEENLTDNTSVKLVGKFVNN